MHSSLCTALCSTLAGRSCSCETVQKHIFLRPVHTSADPLQAHNYVCMVFFILVLQVVTASSLRPYRLWRGACLFPFFKFPFEAIYALFPNRIYHKLKDVGSFQNLYSILYLYVSIWKRKINSVLLPSAWYDMTWSWTYWNWNYFLGIEKKQLCRQKIKMSVTCCVTKLFPNWLSASQINVKKTEVEAFSLLFKLLAGKEHNRLLCSLLT